MRDPYLYPGTEVLKNLADIKSEAELNNMEADYTCLRLSELVMNDYAKIFDINELCRTHYIIFQDVYEWAGKFRIINIEKSEPALGGISIEYSDCLDIEADLINLLDDINNFSWKDAELDTMVCKFSAYMAKLWQIHPFREGNTRTLVTFCSRLIESKGIYIDSELFKDNAQYMRTALVAASAIFSDLGDKRKSEYLERIILDALANGLKMKNEIQRELRLAEIECTEEAISEIVFWNRKEHKFHTSIEIKVYFENIR